MPRFYFEVDLGSEVIADEDGHDLDSLDEAGRVAINTARDFAGAYLLRSVPLSQDLVVEVRDDYHQQVLTVMVSMKIDLRGPAPRRNSWQAKQLSA
jgi:hypothetical protein